MTGLVKKIKIKKQDGTFTDYISLGADAKNVKTEDGISVENKLKKKPYYFNTVADMKNATYLTNGDLAITLGYYEVNDGGNAKYYITDDNELIVNDILVLSLNNNFKAKIIPSFDNSINIRAAGGKSGDATFRKNANIINTIINAGYDCYIPRGNFYTIETISINLRNGGSLYGSSTASKIFKSDQISEFTGDCLVEVYDAGGNYVSETYRGKDAIHDIGFHGVTAGGITGLKIGGDTGDTKEGAISYTQYKNIHFYRCGIALLIQDHSYKINFYNVWWDECPGGLRTKQGINDAGEVINFFGCGLFTGGIYTEQGIQFFGCTIHVSSMNYGDMDPDMRATVYVKNHLVTFTKCHFERIGNDSVYQNMFVTNGGRILIDGPEMVLSGNYIYFQDSVFKTLVTQVSNGSESWIRLTNGDAHYFIGRVRAATGYENDFVLCKGNVILDVGTKAAAQPASTLAYKVYDYSPDNWFDSFENNFTPLKLTGVLTNEGSSYSYENNVLTINTTGSTTNTFGLHRRYNVSGHKSIVLHMNAIANNSNIKIGAFTTKEVSKVYSLICYDKEGNIIYTNNGENGNIINNGNSVNLGSSTAINWLALPNGCEYIDFGIAGWGVQWLNTFSITINEWYCELL